MAVKNLVLWTKFGNYAHLNSLHTVCISPMSIIGVNDHVFAGIAVECLQITPIWKEGHLADAEFKYICVFRIYHIQITLFLDACIISFSFFACTFQIIYVSSRSAPSMALPEGVGFHVITQHFYEVLRMYGSYCALNYHLIDFDRLVVGQRFATSLFASTTLRTRNERVIYILLIYQKFTRYIIFEF